MTIETQKYVRKPVYVDAVRITVANFDEIVTWCQGEVHEEPAKGQGLFKKVIKVEVQHPKNPRQSRAYVGDWILSTDTGYKIYTNKAFRVSFDLVTQGEGKGPVARAFKKAQTVAQAAEDERAEEAKREEEHKRKLVEEGAVTPQGEPIIKVEATPEAIAEAVVENEEARLHSIGPVAADTEGTNGGHPIQVVESYQGKQVLSVTEQEKMTVEQVREALQSGDYILIQDVPSR